MKIKFDHDVEELTTLFETAKVEDKGDIELSDAEIIEFVDKFSSNIQYFDIGTLVVYFGIKAGEPIAKLSMLIETIIEDLGWDKFVLFANDIQLSVDRHQKARKEAMEAQEASEKLED